jgi:hypothetical protein
MSRLAAQRKRNNPRSWAWLLLVPLGVLLAIPPPKPHASSATLIEKIGPLGGAEDAPLVGAARVPLRLPASVELAGYGPFRGKAATDGSATLHARALCLNGLAIATLDVLEIPAALSSEVARGATAASPNVRAVILVATHTHSGPGGFDANPLAQLGARRFDPAIFAALSEGAQQAVQQACDHTQPAELRIGHAAHQKLKTGRGQSASPEPTLWTLQAQAADDHHPVGSLLLFGAHPTLVPGSEHVLSGDWPAAVAKRLERDGSVALVAQGIGGDSSVNRGALDGKGPPVEAFADLVVEASSSDLVDADDISGPLSYASVQITLPQANGARLLAPHFDFLPHGALDRLLERVLPKTAPMAGLSVGPVSFLCVPGELTGAAVERWASADPDLDRLPIITLCGGDISYIEGPDLVNAGTGERLTFYGPGLADAIWIGAEAVLSALGSDVVAR